jgi:hypothetical protein
MEAKKIVHLQFKEPYNGETDFYFGSLKAIYDTVPIGAVGITYKSLTNATRGKSEIPELYRALALNLYNPWADQCRQTATHFILVHSAIEYFIHK